MSATLISVFNWNWLSFLNGSGKFPDLSEVLGSSLSEQVITVLVVPARGRQWFQVFTNVLLTEFVIIAHIHFVNVLAWVAVPQGILAILLPPFTL